MSVDIFSIEFYLQSIDLEDNNILPGYNFFHIYVLVTITHHRSRKYNTINIDISSHLVNGYVLKVSWIYILVLFEEHTYMQFTANISRKDG